MDTVAAADVLEMLSAAELGLPSPGWITLYRPTLL
jgi:hypothetical protein